MKFTKTSVAAAVAVLFSAGAAQAASQTISNASFTMYDGTGALVGLVDNDVTGTIDLAGGTWGVASTNAFFGQLWTAHDGVLLGPGTYTIPTGGGTYTNVVVGPDQIGGHILFDWGTTLDIDVINVWDFTKNPSTNSPFVSTDGPAGNPANPDGILGYGMLDGAFGGFNANFDYTVPSVPIPAAAWLFGSALLGLVGVARRKKSTA